MELNSRFFKLIAWFKCRCRVCWFLFVQPQRDDLLDYRSRCDLIVNGNVISVVAARAPDGLPWRDLGVDMVIETTGLFTRSPAAEGHLTAGARKVIVSAPVVGDARTIVMGVNDAVYDPAAHHVISAASGVTQCVAPMVHVLQREFGISEGFMTIVHACTVTQNLVDGPHQDWRRGRAAYLNIVPTGIMRDMHKVCPEVQGKLTGMAFRIPSSRVSVADVTVRTERTTSYEEISHAMRRASECDLKRILEATSDQVVSSD